MASNAQKTHFALEQNKFAQQKALQAIAKLGRALPCQVIAVSGSIVTVELQVDTAPYVIGPLTMPVATSHYFFEPIQIGDLGVTIPADAYLGGVDGLGGGAPTLLLPATLSALVFQPVANKAWIPTDPTKAEFFGPSGVILRDAMNLSSIVVDTTSITLTCGGHTILINSTGVIIDGVVFLIHQHTEVQTGSDDTGGVLV